MLQLKPTRGIRLSKSHPLARGLVFFPPVNEGAGNKLNDLSGSGNNGTLQADAHFVPGKFGFALDLNGVTDYVDCGIGSSLRIDYAKTILVWFKLPGVISDNERLFSKVRAGEPYDGYSFILWGDGRLAFNNGENWAQSINDYDDGNWHQGVASFDGTDVTFYGDGIIDGTSAITTEIATTDHPAWIGLQSGQYCNCLIDHMAIWNRALSASEVALLFLKPFVMFEDSAQNIARISSIVVSGVVEIAGSLAALSSLTDTALLRRTRGIAGGVTVQSLLTDTAALRRTRGITGGVAAQSSLAGSIKVSKKISGVIAATSSLSGALSLVGEVSRSRGSGFKPIEGAERLRGLRRSAFY